MKIADMLQEALDNSAYGLPEVFGTIYDGQRLADAVKEIQRKWRDGQRSSFEKFYLVSKLDDSDLTRNGDDYTSAKTQEMWKLWQDAE